MRPGGGWVRLSRHARLFCSKNDPFSPYFRSQAKGSYPGSDQPRRDSKRGPPQDRPKRPTTSEYRPSYQNQNAMTRPPKHSKTTTQLQELMEDAPVQVDRSKEVRIVRGMTVTQLSQAMGLKVRPLSAMLESLVGHPPRSDDSVVPLEAAELCVLESGMIPKIVDARKFQNLERAKQDEAQKLALPSRQGVVVVMGHVDHGKTTLIDTLRGSHLAAAEAGGITQNVGAFKVTSKDGTSFTFIDTPGHAAFARMRARGAHVTDVAILVVSAVDGVQHQTIEAIKHGLNSGVPIVVALNKCDLPAADPMRVRGQLIQYGLLAEELGGDVQMVEISAKHGTGVTELLDAVALQLAVVDPRCDPECPADGFVLEANLNSGVGASMTVLPLSGTLKTGDCFVAGATWGRVRSITVEGKSVTSVAPGCAAVVTGLRGVPSAGDEFIVTDSETRAKEVVRIREQHKIQKRIDRNSELAKAVEEAGCKEQCVIIKGDTTGSVEAIIECIHNVPVEEVAMRVIRSGVGPVTELRMAWTRLLCTRSTCVSPSLPSLMRVHWELKSESSTLSMGCWTISTPPCQRCSRRRDKWQHWATLRCRGCLW
eukprot:c20613_g3_i2.p1 GENE.c20613_g3_i2~~c20613_g3_i2.p1  ORF type:complete len:595 (+),score=106.09 c20613_g3_i2:48-1832(+)